MTSNSSLRHSVKGNVNQTATYWIQGRNCTWIRPEAKSIPFAQQVICANAWYFTRLTWDKFSQVEVAPTELFQKSIPIINDWIPAFARMTVRVAGQNWKPGSLRHVLQSKIKPLAFQSKIRDPKSLSPQHFPLTSHPSVLITHYSVLSPQSSLLSPQSQNPKKFNNPKIFL
jgi:hypothetical protein